MRFNAGNIMRGLAGAFTGYAADKESQRDWDAKQKKEQREIAMDAFLMRDKPEEFGTPFEAMGPDGTPRFLRPGSGGGVRVVEGGYVPMPEVVTPRNMDPYSPEAEASKIRAAEAAAASAARHGVVQTVGPDGQPIYTPRSQAAGKDVPQDPDAGLPNSVIERMAGLDNLISMGGDVTATLESAIANKVDVTGRVGGIIPTPAWTKNAAILGGVKGGAVGEDARALIGTLYSTLAKERGGAALSAAEIGILETFLPSINEDEGRALAKAKRFVVEMERMKKSKIDAYQKYGKGAFDDESPMQDRGPVALPPSVDRAKYASDSAYKAWVDSQARQP